MKQEVYTDYENIKEFAALETEVVDPLYDWVFHFNPYINKWNAIHREVYMQHWNGETNGVAKHENINILMSLIRSGDIRYIKP